MRATNLNAANQEKKLIGAIREQQFLSEKQDLGKEKGKRLETVRRPKLRPIARYLVLLCR